METPCSPDFISWWREAKTAGYTPAEFERELRYFAAQASIHPKALSQAVQAAIRRLHDINLAKLNEAVELEWKRANLKH